MTTRMTLENIVLNTYSKVLNTTPVILASADLRKLGFINSLLGAEIAAALKQAYPKLAITPQDVLRIGSTTEMVEFIRRQGLG